MQFMSINNVDSQNMSNIPEVVQYAHVPLFLDLSWQKGGMTRVIGGWEEMGNAITRLADFCSDSICFPLISTFSLQIEKLGHLW